MIAARTTLGCAVSCISSHSQCSKWCTRQRPGVAFSIGTLSCPQPSVWSQPGPPNQSINQSVNHILFANM